VRGVSPLALWRQALDAHDNYHISVTKGDFARTVGIPTTVTVNGTEKEIRTTDFDIEPEESRAHYKNGVEAAKQFLGTWDFQRWKQAYRK